MNSEKISKQIWAVCIILFICIVINFLITLHGGGGDNTKLRNDLSDAYSKIETLEREVAYLNEQSGSGTGGSDKSIRYELLEGRVSILEENGVGSDASINQRINQLEMKVSTLEIAFKQANGIIPAVPAANSTSGGTSTKPAATTTPAQPPSTSNTKPQQPPPQVSPGGKAPIQIQTGSSISPPSPNAKYHTVQSGENLFRISQKYGLTVDQLRRLNGMKEGDVLKAGQRLVVSQ